MGHKDIVSKETIRHIAIDLATILLGLDVEPDSLELLESEQRRIEERQADLVVRLRLRGAAATTLLHIEIQNDNDPMMVWRMLRYRTDIAFSHPGEPVRQYLIYIGRQPLRMGDGIDEPKLRYGYELLDMRTIDCESLLRQDNPDALVLAILCDFKGHDPQEVVNHILTRLHQLLGEKPKRLREYLGMLQILSGNRDLSTQFKEAEKMLTRIEVEKLPFYQIGMERGLEKGIEKGEAALLSRMLRKKFGALPPNLAQRLEQADSTHLEAWGDRVLTANTLEEIFGE